MGKNGNRKGRGGKRTVRSSAGAAVAVITELVDVHATLGGGIVAGDVVGDGGWGGLGGLLEGDSAADFGVAAEDCNWIVEGGLAWVQMRVFELGTACGGTRGKCG